MILQSLLSDNEYLISNTPSALPYILKSHLKNNLSYKILDMAPHETYPYVSKRYEIQNILDKNNTKSIYIDSNMCRQIKIRV